MAKSPTRANGKASGAHASRNERQESAYQLMPEATAGPVGERATGLGVVLFSLAVFAVVFVIVVGIGFVITGKFEFPQAIAAVLLATFFTMSIRIAQQWERVVVQRLGKFNRVKGPGLFLVIPFVEQVAMRVDCRTRATTFGAEQTLTSDLVPMDVNAVLLWMVYDAKAACNEVADFTRTVELAAQAALRDAIGRLTAAEVAIRREQLDTDIKAALEEEAEQWGISILSVKVRDILMPPALHEVMSLEAQAEQRRKARLILTEAEQDISAMLEEVGENYGGGDAALRLRQMHLMYESVRDTGGTVVVPSSFSEGFVENGIMGK